ncbi:MAG: hypothetical protein RIC87_07065 [Kiloniellales bacterium]
MVQSVAIFGNSHVSAIKTAWEEAKQDYPQVSFTFFAARANYMKYIEARDGVLVPTNEVTERSIGFTSGGKSKIDPKEYDCFLVYALGARPYLPDASVFYSDQVHQVTIANRRARQLAWRTVKQIKSVTDRPIIVGENPLPSLLSEQALRDSGDFEEGRVDYTYGVELAERLFYKEHNIRLQRQPLQTIDNGRWTKEEFCKGSERLAIGHRSDGSAHDETDTNHMNTAYGHIWLKAFMPLLQGLRDRGGSENLDKGAKWRFGLRSA